MEAVIAKLFTIPKLLSPAIIIQLYINIYIVRDASSYLERERKEREQYRLETMFLCVQIFKTIN